MATGNLVRNEQVLVDVNAPPFNRVDKLLKNNRDSDIQSDCGPRILFNNAAAVCSLQSPTTPVGQSSLNTFNSVQQHLNVQFEDLNYTVKTGIFGRGT